MKAPQNFNKIDGWNFKTTSFDFRISVYGMESPDIGDYHRVWCIPPTDHKLKNVLYFNFFWQQETYEIVMVGTGAGSNGVLVMSGKLDRVIFQTPENFIKFLSYDIDRLVGKGIYR